MFGSAVPLIEGALAFLAVVGGAALVAGIVAWRRLRRRWRGLRDHVAVRSAVAFAGVLRSGRPDRLAPARLRYELWQSVGAATRAVRGAEAAGGTVADLPSLNRRLRASAEDLDRLLLMAEGLRPTAPQVGELRRQVAEALEASSAIRLAALASANDAASVRVGALAADAGREVTSVAEGVARSKAALGRS